MSTRLSSGEVRFFLLWATIAFLVVLLVAGCDVAPERPTDPPDAPKAGMGMRVQGAVFAASADEGAITSIVEEGAALVPLRVRWSLPAKPDSQRLVVTDSLTAKSYLNVKVAASWRTRTFEAPRDRIALVRLTAYKGGAVLATDRVAYLVGSGELIPPPPPVDTVVTPPDSTPTDTVVPVPPEDGPYSYDLLKRRVDLTLHACDRQYVIGANLQTALDTVKRGDCIRLPANAVYSGNFVLRAKPGTGWIQIYSYAAFPDDGIRFQPTKYPNVATIRTPNVAPALTTAPHPDASYYRIMGVKFDVAPTVTMAYAITDFNNNGATAVDQIPHHIILDRVWVQGHDGLDTQRCVAMNTGHSAVVNSWLEGCHHTGSDAQAIIVWNSPGPLAFDNNYLEGSGENIMIGGADPRIQGLVPTDITTCRNHINKPIAWQTVATHSNGKLWAVKNSIETKNVRRWLICGNEVTNNWKSGQTGFILVMKSSNQSGGCPWCVAEEVIVERNRFVNSPSFANFKALDDYSFGGGIGMNRVTVRANYADRVGWSTVSGADRRIYQMLGHATDTLKTLRDIVIEGNVVNTTTQNYMMFDGGPTLRLTMRNNVGYHGMYGVFGSGSGVGASAWNAWTRHSTASGNILVTKTGDNLGAYPAGFTLTPTWPQNVPGAVDTTALIAELQGVVVPR